MTWPVIVFWALLVWGLVSPRPVLIYLFFAAAPFGALAVIPVEWAGGVNLLPQAVCASALLLRVALRPDVLTEALNALLARRRLGLLAAFLAVSVVVTLFAPRLFAGAVDVVSIGGALRGPEPLVAGTHNVTQTAYLSLSVLTVAAFAVLVRTPAQLATVRDAMVLGGIVMVASGALAVASDWLGRGDQLLEPFHTVSYVLLTEDEALGARRLAGLMPEASAFGASCVLSGTTIALLCPCFEGWRRRAAAATAIALLVLAAMSTASTAYIGLAATAGLLVFNWLRRLLTRRVPRPTSGEIEFIVLSLVLAVVLWLVLFDPRPLTYAADMLDLMLFQKTTSTSYLERMQWNATALDGLTATFGLGVGLGSARASNWFIALASNTGLVGAGLMLGFIAQTLMRRPAALDPIVTETMSALKIAILLALVLAITSGTSADFGVGNAAMYGVIAAIAYRDEIAPAWLRQRAA